MKEGREWGFIFCRGPRGDIRGPESSGTPTNVTLNLRCPSGQPLAVFHCLPATEYVFLPGYGPMRVDMAAKKWPDVETHKVTELISIQTGLMGSITVTPNHPIMTKQGWVLASDLIVGDKILLETNLPCPSNIKVKSSQWKTNWWSRVHHRPYRPQKLSPELGLLLGLLWSDGSISDQRVSFANKQESLISQVSNLTMLLFGLEGKTYNGSNNVYQFHVNSTDLAHYFQRNLGFTKERVPHLLWSAPPHIRQHFLNGVIQGDGSTSPANPNKPNDLVTSISVGNSKETAISLAYFIATLGHKPRLRIIPQHYVARTQDFMYQVVFQSGSHDAPLRSPSGRLVHGGRTIGNEVKIIDIKRQTGNFEVYDFHMAEGLLYCGTLPFLTHNTHPGTGNIIPSDKDFETARAYRIPFVCVGIPETEQVKCYRVPR